MNLGAYEVKATDLHCSVLGFMPDFNLYNSKSIHLFSFLVTFTRLSKHLCFYADCKTSQGKKMS